MDSGRFLTWCDRRNFVSVRAFTLYATLWLTWAGFRWAAEYAHEALAARTAGLDVAAIISAVTVPITALQTFTFKLYVGARQAPA